MVSKLVYAQSTINVPRIYFPLYWKQKITSLKLDTVMAYEGSVDFEKFGIIPPHEYMRLPSELKVTPVTSPFIVRVSITSLDLDENKYMLPW